MNILETEWKEFIKGHTPSKRPDVVQKDMQTAFYAGAFCTLANIKGASKRAATKLTAGEIAEDEAAMFVGEYIEYLERECKAYLTGRIVKGILDSIIGSSSSPPDKSHENN